MWTVNMNSIYQMKVNHTTNWMGVESGLYEAICGAVGLFFVIYL